MKNIFDFKKNSNVTEEGMKEKPQMRHGKDPVESIKNMLWSDKKRKTATCVVAGVLTVGIVAGTAFWLMPNNTRADADTVTESAEKKHTEEDLDGVVSGLEDKYIVQDATGIDYLHDTQVNKDIVKYVDADSSDVDLGKTGDYKVKYTVTVNSSELSSYLKEDVEDDKKATEKITFDKTVTVVTPEEGQKLADEGKVVITNDNQTVPKSDGTVVEVPEKPIENATTATPTPEAEKNSNKGNSSSDSSSNKNNSSSSSNSGSSSSNSGNGSSNSGGSSSSGSSSGSSTSGGGNSNSSSGSGGNNSSSTDTPAKHEHSWAAITSTVHHEATGHYETQVVQAAYDEPIYESRSICNGCGADITSNIDHIFECDPGSFSNKKVQVGTKHHDAVTKQVWVQDSAAWDETVTTGHKCSGCGKTK